MTTIRPNPFPNKRSSSKSRPSNWVAGARDGDNSFVSPSVWLVYLTSHSLIRVLVVYLTSHSLRCKQKWIINEICAANSPVSAQPEVSFAFLLLNFAFIRYFHFPPVLLFCCCPWIPRSSNISTLRSLPVLPYGQACDIFALVFHAFRNHFCFTVYILVKQDQVGQYGATCGSSNEGVTDQPTNRPTDGHNQL